MGEFQSPPHTRKPCSANTSTTSSARPERGGLPGRGSRRLTKARPEAAGLTRKVRPSSATSMNGFSTGLTSIARPKACSDHWLLPATSRALKPEVLSSSIEASSSPRYACIGAARRNGKCRACSSSNRACTGPATASITTTRPSRVSPVKSMKRNETSRRRSQGTGLASASTWLSFIARHVAGGIAVTSARAASTLASALHRARASAAPCRRSGREEVREVSRSLRGIVVRRSFTAERNRQAPQSADWGPGAKHGVGVDLNGKTTSKLMPANDGNWPAVVVRGARAVLDALLNDAKRTCSSQAVATHPTQDWITVRFGVHDRSPTLELRIANERVAGDHKRVCQLASLVGRGMEKQASLACHREIDPRNEKYGVSFGLLGRAIANTTVGAGCLHDHGQQEAGKEL